MRRWKRSGHDFLSQFAVVSGDLKAFRITLTVIALLLILRIIDMSEAVSLVEMWGINIAYLRLLVDQIDGFSAD